MDPPISRRDSHFPGACEPPPVEFAVLGGPDDGPTLDLDHERFAYAGKFVVSGTGKAVVRDAGEVVAAASFDRDRTDDTVARVRYVTVRADRRGEGVGARLLAFLAEHLLDDARRVLIAVNNGFAYEAAYKAGFSYTGERTGMAELVLARPGDRSAETYLRGVETLRSRESVDEGERAFLDGRTGPPAPVGSIRRA